MLCSPPYFAWTNKSVSQNHKRNLLKLDLIYTIESNFFSFPIRITKSLKIQRCAAFDICVTKLGKVPLSQAGALCMEWIKRVNKVLIMERQKKNKNGKYRQQTKLQVYIKMKKIDMI